MRRAADIAETLLADVASGRLGPGAQAPSVRALARREGVAPATAARALHDLAAAGVLATAPRRAARVADGGPALARRRLGGDRALLLAGSDDPLLDVLVTAAGAAVARRPAAGSFAGLIALWQGDADAATLHLWHRSGEHNAPYAARVLAGREPVLVRLWRREQVIVVPPGNPHAVEGIEDLARVTVARRRPGTGTRTLADRLLRERGIEPARVHGPEVGSHLEAALAVASGVADAAVGVRAAATALGLDAVPLAWEPFDLVVPADRLAPAQALLDGLAEPELRRRAAELGGYDLGQSGAVAAAG